MPTADQHLVNNYTKGIPKTAAIMSLDPNFTIFRQFAQAQIQVILYRQ